MDCTVSRTLLLGITAKIQRLGASARCITREEDRVGLDLAAAPARLRVVVVVSLGGRGSRGARLSRGRGAAASGSCCADKQKITQALTTVARWSAG